MTELTTSTRVRSTSDQVSSELGEEVVILHVKNGMYYGLDAVGVAIWRKLQAGSTVGGIVDNILEEFDVSREQCEQDVIRILKEMMDAQLVVLEIS